MTEMTTAPFCTVINCMDGRIQLPVLDYLRDRFQRPFVDNITIAGPVRILKEQQPAGIVRAVLERLRVSVELHGSRSIAVVAHHDCAGNPVSEARQLAQLKPALAWVKQHYPQCEVIGLWVDHKWQVTEISD